MLKSGLSSQSGGSSLGLLDDFWFGLGDRPGVEGEKARLDEIESEDAASPEMAFPLSALSLDVEDAHLD